MIRIKRKYKVVFFFFLVFFIAFGFLRRSSQLDLDEIIKRFHKITYENCKVFIIEEHHEVIPFWLRAMQNKNSAFLVHYDAHSDFALPAFMEQRRNELPRTLSELVTFMPSNDMFINSFALTGLLDRAHLIFPPWTPPIIEEFDWDVVDIGFVKDEFLSEYQHLAQTYFHLDPDREVNKMHCLCKDFNCHVTFNETQISHEECEPFQDFLLKFTLLPDPKSSRVKTDQSLILDIDEDFFGVQLPISSLTPYFQENHQVIENVQSVLSSVFCVDRSQDDAEEQMRQLFVRLVINPVIECKTRRNCDERVREDLFHQLFRTNRKILCSTNEYFQKMAWKNFFNWIIELSIEDIKALSKIGLCYLEHPLSYEGFHSESRMGLCIGRILKPPNTSVIEHLSIIKSSNDTAEAEGLFKMFEDDLKIRLSHIDPQLVTIARSTRDGYTPRHRQQEVERRILNILKKTFTSIRDENICYSSALLGGKRGWYQA